MLYRGKCRVYVSNFTPVPPMCVAMSKGDQIYEPVANWSSGDTYTRRQARYGRNDSVPTGPWKLTISY